MHADCYDLLQKNRRRGTKTREVILDCLHAASGPLSPPELVSHCRKRGSRVNKTTVYRVLGLLERLRLVRRVIVSDRKQYFELSERGHHHHFICTRCEKVEDIQVEESSLLDRTERLGRRLGFAIESHAVEFYGRCATCLNAKQPLPA